MQVSASKQNGRQTPNAIDDGTAKARTKIMVVASRSRVAPTASILLVLSGYVGTLLVGGGHDCRQIETTQEEHGGLSLQRPDGFSTSLSGAL